MGLIPALIRAGLNGTRDLSRHQQNYSILLHREFISCEEMRPFEANGISEGGGQKISKITLDASINILILSLIRDSKTNA